MFGIFSTLEFFVYSIALKIEAESSFSRKAFQWFFLAALIA